MRTNIRKCEKASVKSFFNLQRTSKENQFRNNFTNDTREWEGEDKSNTSVHFILMVSHFWKTKEKFHSFPEQTILEGG